MRTRMKGNSGVAPKNARKTLIRLFAYFKFNRALFYGGLVFIFVSSIAQVLANGMLSPIVDLLGTNFDKALFVKYLLIMGGLVVFVSLAQYVGNLFMGRLAQKTVHKIREDMFSHMEELPVSYFDTHSHGELMSTFTNDVDILNQALEQSVSQIVIAAVTIIGAFVIMFIISPLLTLLVVVMLIVMLLATKFIGKKSARNFRVQQATLSEMNGYIEEMMSGQKVVKVFNYEERAIEEFGERNERLRKSSTEASTYGVMLMPIMGSLTFVLYALVSMAGALLVVRNILTIGNIAAFLQYTRTISRPITNVSNQLNMLFAAIAGAERIFDILDEDVEIDDGDVRLVKEYNGKKELAWKVPVSDNKFEYVPVEGYIKFKDVDFGYVSDQKVLKNIDIYAKPGQKIALVGSTGAGKTTITNLINRFYEINNRTILYDGVEINRINKKDLRSTMSIVLQDVHLFEGTVADNIRYGRLDASDEEVIKAAKLANADYFIQHLPQGYDTVLSRDGGNLSQGERQLLSIARAAIADPIILILDEATSSVDTRTEKLISEGMDKLMEGRTTFVIAHRLSTVRDSNAIMVLEQGEIIERGDHNELMENRGRYYALNTGSIELE